MHEINNMIHIYLDLLIMKNILCCGVLISLPERRLMRVGMGVGVCVFGVDVGGCGCV